MAIPRLYPAGRNLRRDTPKARKGSIYYTDFRVDGKRHRLCLGPVTHGEALDLLDEAMKAAKLAASSPVPAHGPYMIADAQAALVTRQAKTLALNTLNKYAVADRQALAWFGPTAFLGEVTRETVETWLEHRDEDVGPCTLNRDLKRLRQVFSFAVEKGWAVSNPLAGIPLWREPELDIVPLTPEQRERIKTACPSWLWDMARFAMLTGLRQVEQLTLRRDQISGDQIRVDPKVAKSRKSRIVVMPPAAVKIVEGKLVSHRHQLVFPTPLGAAWNRNNLMHRHWRPAVLEAGLKGVTWHRLRHEYASSLIASGAPEYAVKELAGWESTKMLKRYAHLAPDYLRDVVKVLE